MSEEVSDRQVILLLLLIIIAIAIAAAVMMDGYAKRVIIVTSMVLDCDDKTGVCMLLATETIQKELKNNTNTDPKLKKY